MIARLIAWSARNLLLVLFGTTFAAAAGLYALAHLPLDAIPDLSDTQVIVYTEYPGQAPQVIEDQVTYPLTTAMLTVPRSKVVRGFSFFGVSFVYVIFEDGTDIYWARSRVLEFLNSAASRLPAGVTPTMGPDATGVGWVYQYAVMSRELNLSDTRAIQDWNLKFALAKAEGVAEVASVGGFVRQYNIVLDPQRMRDLGITMPKMRDAIRASNADVGGRTVELSEFEYVIRGKGYLRGINDLGNIVLKASNGTPVLLRDIARVELGPDERRGIAELNGEGEVASGIVLQRFGVNALDVIQNVKKRFAEIASSLPKSVEIVPVYDRSNLINAAIDTLKHTLLEECIIVALVCIVFLLHVRSALVAILMLPVGVLMAFGAMKLLGLGSNIMSLGGIAIAIGAMVDAAIVMIENAHKHLERAEPGQSRVKILIEAAAQVGPALFFSLLIITVSFMPIFTLEAQEGRLFSPLAFTKTFAMAAAAILSVTLVPALMIVFVRGKIIPEHKNPINRFLIWIYRPVIKAVMRAKIGVILIALAILAVTVWPARQLGTEFMPNLNEGTLLYMPTTLPGISVTKAAELLQMQDRIIRGFPEVESVYGKAGRAATATDPAPTEMFETIINLKPKAEWRAGLTLEGLTAEMDKALQFPGVSNAWTQPIKARIDMLSTGIRTPIGVKVIGTDLVEIDRLAKQVEQVLRTVPGTSSAYAERGIGGYYLDIVPDRAALARYGIMIQDVQDVIATALGGQTVTTTVEGRQRFSVNMRYPRDLRSDPQTIARDVLVPMPAGGAVPLGEVAKVAPERGPTSIRTENGQLAVYVYVDIRDRDIGGYVADAQDAVRRQHPVSAGRLPDVERAVRVSGAGGGAAENRRAGDARDHLPAALSQLPLADGNADRDAVAAVRAGRRSLADVVARLQPVGRRGGRLHRAGRCCRRDRRGDADLPQPGAGRAAGAQGRRRRRADAKRSLRRHHGRRGGAGASEDDDGGRDHGRTAADHVEHRHRFGDHAAHRGADDRRYDLLDAADADRDPGRVRPPQRFWIARRPRTKSARCGDCEAIEGSPTCCGARRIR